MFSFATGLSAGWAAGLSPAQITVKLMTMWEGLASLAKVGSDRELILGKV